jgi:glycosyltransferase involved in cell wall biosynthesis
MNASEKIRLMILGHANRYAGGLSVGQNLLAELLYWSGEFEMMAVLPACCGYESIVKDSPIQKYWFAQQGSRLRRYFFDQIVLKRLAQQFRPDAVLALGHLGFPSLGGIQLVRLADAHFVYPKNQWGPMSWKEKLRYGVQQKQFLWTVRNAAVIYCQTQTMMQRLQDKYHPAGWIRLLPNVLGWKSVEETGKEPLRIPDWTQRRFRMICLCRYYGHKNLEIFVPLYKAYREQLRDTLLFLTIEPHQDPRAARLLCQIEREGLQGQIVNLGPIPQSAIGRYFSQCQALLFPTLLESFSATYLEAMHYGLPIITSRMDFAQEICEDAALYCEPLSVNSIYECIERLRKEPMIVGQLKKAMSDRIAVLSRWTWKQNAERIVNDIKELVRTGGRC